MRSSHTPQGLALDPSQSLLCDPSPYCSHPGSDLLAFPLSHQSPLPCHCPELLPCSLPPAWLTPTHVFPHLPHSPLPHHLLSVCRQKLTTNITYTTSQNDPLPKLICTADWLRALALA